MTRKFYEFDMGEQSVNDKGTCFGNIFKESANCSRYSSCFHHVKSMFDEHEVIAAERTGKRVIEYVPIKEELGLTLYRKVVTCSGCGEQVDTKSNYCHKCGVRLVEND